MPRIAVNYGLVIAGIVATFFLVLAVALIDIQSATEPAQNWVRFMLVLAILLITVVGGSLIKRKSR